MPCNYPIRAYKVMNHYKGRVTGTEIVFDSRSKNVIQELQLPCGSCEGCRLERARQWAVRCVHEASLHDQNCVITLTYNNKHLPINEEIVYKDYQDFFKRFRKSVNQHTKYQKKSKWQGPLQQYKHVRYLVCGEYGENRGRPHFHACIFGYNFDDRVYFKRSHAGTEIYTSERLNKFWSDNKGDSMGFCTLGSLDFASASYISRYITKKLRGGLHETCIDLETGATYERQSEFIRMSNGGSHGGTGRKGIGYLFYKKWFNDIFPRDYCVIEGKQIKPPKYYNLKLKKENPNVYSEVETRRYDKAVLHQKDNNEDRRMASEKILIQKSQQILKRELIKI